MFEYLIVDKIHELIIALDGCIGKYACQSKKGEAFVYLENIKSHEQAFNFYLKQIKQGKKKR